MELPADQQELPEDLIETAYKLTESAWQQRHPDIAMRVARALLAERLSATERAAKIAEETVVRDRTRELTDARDIYTGHYENFTVTLPKWKDGPAIAAAIRSQP